MKKYIPLDDLVTEIERTINEPYPKHDQQCDWEDGYCSGLYKALSIIEDTLEVKEVDLEKESELIANGIMISVQSNKYGTNIYNTERNDFNHYHLQMAARKGIELGLKATQKGE